MTPADIFVVASVAVLGVVLGVAIGMFYLIRRRRLAGRRTSLKSQATLARQFSRFEVTPNHPVHMRRPTRWLAILYS
ncbi:MAG: hypothetical protein QM813_05110 [Verrucomicrobiota bacterium]